MKRPFFVFFAVATAVHLLAFAGVVWWQRHKLFPPLPKTPPPAQKKVPDALSLNLPALPAELPAGQPFAATLQCRGEEVRLRSEPVSFIFSGNAFRWEQPAAGEYTIVFTASDRAGGQQQAAWKVKVVSPKAPEATKPEAKPEPKSEPAKAEKRTEPATATQASVAAPVPAPAPSTPAPAPSTPAPAVPRLEALKDPQYVQADSGTKLYGRTRPGAQMPPEGYIRNKLQNGAIRYEFAFAADPAAVVVQVEMLRAAGARYGDTPDPLALNVPKAALPRLGPQAKPYLLVPANVWWLVYSTADQVKPIGSGMVAWRLGDYLPETGSYAIGIREQDIVEQ